MNVRAMVNYHVKSAIPQAFEFDANGIAGNLISPKLLSAEVEVQDLRDNSKQVDFFSDGILFADYPSTIDKFNDALPWQQTYDNELRSLLRNKLSAKEVMVFDHTIRVDDENAVRKPARNVHTDYSQRGAEQRLIDLVGKNKSKQYSQGHYAFVNIWRPIEHEIMTSPLGFIRPSSMQVDDWITIELHYPDRIGEILGVVNNSAHQWLYLSRMSPKEVAIFNIFDNKNVPQVGHSALDLVASTTTPQRVRKSIESRTLIRY